MAKADKMLEAMRANPAGDWTISDIEKVAKGVGLTVRTPRRGSHYTISHPDLDEILTIPARRPLKPVYLRKFVSMIDSIT